MNIFKQKLHEKYKKKPEKESLYADVLKKKKKKWKI